MTVSLYTLKNFIVQFSWWLCKEDWYRCLSLLDHVNDTYDVFWFHITVICPRWPFDPFQAHFVCVCVCCCCSFPFALYCFDNCNLNQIWKRSRIKYILILCWLCTYIKPLLSMWFVKTSRVRRGMVFVYNFLFTFQLRLSPTIQCRIDNFASRVFPTTAYLS